MKQISIGILAHVDSGKTTLSEAMLYQSGEIRKLGRVDHKDAFLDTHEIERDRGITIFSKQALLHLPDTAVTLLDTPGHVDFSAETERTLQVLDYAILVISGSEGVQSHTETLWNLLIRYKIPTYIFVNKMDLSASDRDSIMADIKSKLSNNCINFSVDRTDSEFLENIAVCDEQLTENFLENRSPTQSDIARVLAERKVFACYFGSALKLDGVAELLDGLDKYTVSPDYKSEFGAKVFKITEDDKGNRLTHMKITGGRLCVKDIITQKESDGNIVSEKVNQIRIYSGAKFTAADCAESGTVCAVTGLTRTAAGDGLGSESSSTPPVLEPVLTYQVILPDNVAPHTALFNLRRLEEEDPLLHVVWNERLQEIHMQLMGEVQLDIIKRLVAERFKLDVSFGPGSISYKETIAAPVEGVGHYEPLRHYAEVHVLLEPLARGSGM